MGKLRPGGGGREFPPLRLFRRSGAGKGRIRPVPTLPLRPPLLCPSLRPHLQRMPYHYYEPKGPDECVTYIQNENSRKGNHHRFITEKRVFSSWAQLYGITFSHPSWT